MAMRVGVIGAGRSGRAHLESLAGLPEAHVAAVCDTDRARAEAAAQPLKANVHINFRTLLESERLDAVVITVPPFARGEPEIAAARAGIHLLVESPVAGNVEKARLIQQEIEKAGIVAAVASPWRHHGEIERVRELLKDRRIALVRLLNLAPPPPEGWRRRRDAAGGQFILEATDMIDLARHLAGEMMLLFAVQHQGLMAARMPDYDIEDALAAVIRFQKGAAGELLSSSASTRHERSVSFVADELELRLTPDALETIEPGRQTHYVPPASSLQRAHRLFLEAVRTGRMSGGQMRYADAVRSLEIAHAAAASAQTGKVVSL